MKTFIDILNALPVRKTAPLVLPVPPTDMTDINAVLAYSAKCLQVKADWERENSIDPATDAAIACAHILATLPPDKLGSVAEDAARRAYTLAGLATVTKGEFAKALQDGDEKALAPFAEAYARSSLAKEPLTLAEAMRTAKLAPAAQQMFRGVLADNLQVERVGKDGAKTQHTVKSILDPIARKWAKANSVAVIPATKTNA